MKKCCLTCGWYRNGICTNEINDGITLNIENDSGGNLYEQFIWKRFEKHYFVEDITNNTESGINYEEIVDEMFGEMKLSDRFKNNVIKRLKNLEKEITETVAKNAVSHIQDRLESDAEDEDDPSTQLKIENPNEFYCSNHWE